MIVHINHISQSKKPRNGKPSPQSEMAGLVTGSLMSLVEDGVLDAKMAPSLRIHLDWIQYKTNFRDPVMVRRTTSAQGQALPLAEIAIRATPSSGPGGQHVNRSSTRVEVVWNVVTSPVLSEAQRSRLLLRLASRIDSEGDLRVVASDHRSQLRNRMEALERLAGVVSRALAIPKARRATKPTRASKERRLESKKRRGDTKRERRRPHDD